MEVTFVILFTLFVVLAVVTLVGHGIWVFLTFLLGGRRNTVNSVSSADLHGLRRSCPRCLTPLGSNSADCPACGWPRAVGRLTSDQAALAALSEQLERLAAAGAVDDEARSHLLLAIAAQKERLAAERAAEFETKAQQEQAGATPPMIDRQFVEPNSTELQPSPSGRASEEDTALPNAPPLSTPERVHRYAASRAIAAAEAETHSAALTSDTLATAVPHAKQREAISRLFATFMEEKNIRWGELVGGLLIVGCSIALVISFWSEIAQRPLLKFGLLGGVTAALFGVGLYTERRWKLHTTSHGVLVIASLLVPLNFLAIAAFTHESPPTDLWSLAGEGVSLALFSLLLFLAGRILVPGAPLWLTAGVMIPSLMQLIVRRFAEPGSSLVVQYALAIVPVLAYVATCVTYVAKRVLLAQPVFDETSPSIGEALGANETSASDASGTQQTHTGEKSDTQPGRRDETPTLDPRPSALRLTEMAAHRVLIFLGIVSVAVVGPLALLAFKLPPLQETLHWLAPLGIPLGLPALLVGLVFWKRLRHANLSGLQTAGIAVGALGSFVMLAAIILAWPDPATLLPTAVIAGALFVAVAYWFEIPAAHLPAGLAAGAAWLIGFHYLRGNVGWTLPDYQPISRALLSATSGKMLMPLAALFGAAVAWMLRRRRRDDGLMYGILSALTGIASVALLLAYGFARVGDPHDIAWLLGLYALAGLAVAVRVDRPAIAWGGLALLFVTLVQTIVYRYGESWQLERPWIATLLTFASIATCALAAASWLRLAVTKNLRAALNWSALGASVVTGALIVATMITTSSVTLATNLAWLAAVCLVLAILNASAEVFAASQIAAAAAIFWAVVVAVETRPWYVSSIRAWLDPWFLQSQGIALSAFCLGLDLLRKLLGRFIGVESVDDQPSGSTSPPALIVGNRLLNPRSPTFDEILENVLVAVVILVALYAALPGAGQELALIESARGAAAATRVVPPIGQFEIAEIPHEHAADYGTWLFAAVALSALSLGNARFHWMNPRWGAIAIAMMITCALLAQHWESDVAVASALRWLSAGMFAVASALLWFRQRSDITVAGLCEAGTGVADPGYNVKAYRDFRNLLVALMLLLYVAMGVYVSWQAVRIAGAPSGLDDWLPYMLAWAAIAGAGAIALPRVFNSQSRSFGGESIGTRSWVAPAAGAILLLAVAPLAILLTFVLAKTLDQHPIVGPEFGSWFREIGWDVSYGAPLAAIALTLVGYAVRDRSSRFAFGAGLLLNVVATIVVLMRLARTGGGLDASAWIQVAQVNAIVAGAVALCWLAARAWHRRGRALAAPVAHEKNAPAEPVAHAVPPALLVTQVVLAAALCGTFIVPATISIVLESSQFAALPGWVGDAGALMGWSATALAMAAAAWLNWGRTLTQHHVGLLIAALVAMVALTVANHGWGNWPAYNTLLVGSCAAAWLLPLATRFLQQLLNGAISDVDARIADYSWSHAASRLFAATAVGLAIYEYSSVATWWTPAALAVISARNMWISWQERRRGFMWIAAMLCATAVSIWWIEWGNALSSASAVGEVFEFLWVNTLGVALMVIVSVWIERRPIINRGESLENRSMMAFHRFAAWLIVVALALTTGFGLVVDLLEDPISANVPLAWAAWGAALLAAIACWWDSASRWPVACVYCIGLLAVGLYLDGLDFHAPMFQWALANGLAAYSLATSYLWSQRAGIRTTLARFGVPVAPACGSPSPAATSTTAEFESQGAPVAWAGDGHAWLVSANVLIGFGVLALVAWIELSTDSFTQRMIAAYAIGAQALALALLARGAVRTSLQYASLVFGVLFAVGFGWAWLPPGHAAPWLHRAIVSLVAVAVMVVLYGFGLVKILKRENEWTRAAARLVPLLAVVAAGLMATVLGIEVVTFMEEGSVPIAWPALIAVAAALIGLAIAALAAALIPGRDPLGLSERGRTVYVYAAEALVGLLFLHIRVTMPWLFSGWFLRFWPLVVMLIAFIGVGLAELFQRRRQSVLSEPLRTTGALLPLLPALGFWVVTSEVDYSLLLLSVGVLYAGLAVLRGSFWFGILAAISANGSLWYLLYKREGLGLLEHPQLWLIPPALSALAAGYINRERLSREQSAALRYVCAIVIYVSSTADIFINGVADAPWLPAVLAGISILGVFAGILLRVRAFLYLGTSFLVIAILTIIWYAAVEQERTYILWIAGIVTGVLIIALFGLFEKRRDDVQRLVEELKHWQA